MQQILSSDLWKAVRGCAKKARRNKAAIAYVTRDLIGLRKDDVLVVDASARAVSSGATDAKLLRALCEKGVRIHDCRDLHAKVLLLDDVAVIGSGNMSGSGLIEAALMTDHGSTVAGVASFIEQLVQQSDQLQARQIAELCKIKVIRRRAGGRRSRKPKVTRLGNRTWLVGVYDLATEPPPAEERLIAQAFKQLRPQMRNPTEEPDWIRWSGRNRFVRQCQAGDSLIQVWRSSNKVKRPKAVIRAVPVLLKQRGTTWTRFYLPSATAPLDRLPWGRFKRLLKEVGYSDRVGPSSARLLDTDIADAIARKWRSAAGAD
jgi:hypothetical protein